MSDGSLSLFARDSVLERCFRDFDEGERGVLDRKGLHFALTALLGRRPTEFELASVMGSESAVGMRDFVVRARRLVRDDAWTEPRQMFAAFDVECRGYLTLEGVKRVFAEVCPGMSAEVVEDAFAEADERGRGKLSLRQFLRMVSTEGGEAGPAHAESMLLQKGHCAEAR